MTFPSNDSLKAQLAQNGYVGDVNTSLVRYLRNLYSIADQNYNNLLYHHLGQLGYTGSLNDRIRRWDGTLWSPLALFQASEQGVWYDPSDFSTMFQNSNGITPVTAVGQAVGLILDKSRGMVLGPEKIANGGFDSSTGWTLGVWTVSNGMLNSTAVGGAIGNATYAGGVSTTAGVFHKITFTVVTKTATQIYIALGSASYVIFPAGTGTFTMYLPTTGTDGLLYIRKGDAAAQISIDNLSVCELPGYHASQPTSTARPILQQDSSGRYYLSFDGVDDFLVTSAINFSATDNASIFAGVRSLNNGISEIVELSASTALNTGTFALRRGTSSLVTGAYSSRSRGDAGAIDTQSADGLSNWNAPSTNTLIGLHDISLDSSAIYVNGTLETSGSTDKGLGNWGAAYPLYIGMRAGTSNPFNGRIYSLIVRGVMSSAAEIASVERYVNSKTGAY